MVKKIIECVPNFSEGRSKDIIDLITKEITNVKEVELLDVDMGYDTNRTVVTFAGSPDSVIVAAFNSIAKAATLIDMRNHRGAHPRMGATDVCPIVPIKNISIEECVELSKKLAKKIASNLSIPVFLYEHSATSSARKNLANLRSGEYEGMEAKIKEKIWKPDFGPAKLNKKSGVTAVGVRDFLIAYNVNLNTKDRKKATDIALDIREQGRAKRGRNGKILRDNVGKILKIPGTLKNVKAVGWYIDEYKQAQVSINLTNYKITPLYKVFEEVRKQANKRGLRVTGSEIVGLIPKNALLEVGNFYLKKQKSPLGIPEKDIIAIAIQSLGLTDITDFDPNKLVIEYALSADNFLINKDLKSFMDELSRDSATPGGGSVSALAGSLSASLISMTLSLSSDKKLDKYAMQSQNIKEDLLLLIEDDAKAFDVVMTAFRLSKKTKEDRKTRLNEIEISYKKAITPPLLILEKINTLLVVMNKVYKKISNNCMSDFGVAIEMASASINGAIMNVNINLKEISDKKFINETNKKIKILSKNIDNYLITLNKNIEI